MDQCNVNADKRCPAFPGRLAHGRPVANVVFRVLHDHAAQQCAKRCCLSAWAAWACTDCRSCISATEQEELAYERAVMSFWVLMLSTSSHNCDQFQTADKPYIICCDAFVLEGQTRRTDHRMLPAAYAQTGPSPTIRCWCTTDGCCHCYFATCFDGELYYLLHRSA